MILLNQVIELWVVALPGLWVTGYHRIMGFPPYTNSGTPKTYGLSQVMAYEGYGLRGCRLYYGAVRCETESESDSVDLLSITHHRLEPVPQHSVVREVRTQDSVPQYAHTHRTYARD